jgi:hypothetical protein
MRKFAWIAALAVFGCSATVRQAPHEGLSPRPARQYPEEVPYPQAPSAEDIAAEALPPTAEEASPGFGLMIDHESWPGNWIIDDLPDGAIRGSNLETRCQATVIPVFDGEKSAMELAEGARRDVLEDNFSETGPVEEHRDGAMATVNFSDGESGIFGRLTIITYYDSAPGLHVHNLILCPSLEPVDAVSSAVTDSVKVITN